jgi:flagellin
MNIGSINALANSVNSTMTFNSGLAQNALSRLSSGMRLNSAADDASSMQIADSLRSDANTTAQEIKNYNDEIGIFNTIDKAIDEQTKMLDLIKVKSIQMANDSQNEESRKAIKADINKLLDSIDNIANTTQYNGKSLLSGQFGSRHGLEVGSTDTSKTGHTNIQHSRAISTAGETQLTFRNGIDTVTLESVEIGTQAGTGVGTLAEVINKNSDKLGVKADWTVKSVGETIAGGDIEDFKINGVMIGTIEDIKVNDRDGRLVNAINNVTDKTGVVASTSTRGQLVLESVDGRGIKIESKDDNENRMGAHGVFMLENYGSISLTKTNAAASMDVEATGVLTNGFASHDQVFTLSDFKQGFKTTGVGYGTGEDYGNGADQVGLNEFKNSSVFANMDGKGFTVAVLDTGVDADHEAFGPDSDGDGLADRVLAQVDFTGDGVGDVHGHGSHVAGIIASAGDANGNYQGIASEANIVDVKVLSNAGPSVGTSVRDGLRWVIENAEEYNITAINMSLGSTEYNTEFKEAWYHEELQTLKDMGIINLAAAGNDFNGPSTPGISVPGADRATIGVGALVTTDSTQLAEFSQRAEITSQIFAPGNPIMSVQSGGGWTNMSGTSMATPFVAGAAILSQQLAESELGRRLNQDEFLSLLRSSAVDVYDGDNEGGAGETPTDTWYKRIDVDALGHAIIDYAQEIRGADGAYQGQTMASVAESGIAALDKIRADVGSTTNNLVSKINNASVKEVQLKASESQLRDADFAAESAAFQKQNILAQSGSYAMSQVMRQYDQIKQLLA